VSARLPATPSDGTQVGLNVGMWELDRAFRVADKGDWGEPACVGWAA